MKTLIELSDKSLMQIIRLSKQRQDEIKQWKFDKTNWEFKNGISKWNNKTENFQKQINFQQNFWLN